MVREDAKNPIPHVKNPNEMQEKGSMVSEMGAVGDRRGMQAPILMRASSGKSDFKMASEKERRDVMMRSSSGGDEMSDDVNVENVRTPADNLRLTVRIVTGLLIIAAVAALIIYVIIPTWASVKNASDTTDRLDFLISKLDENKSDPEVAAIIEEYAANYGGESSGTAEPVQTSQTEVTDQTAQAEQAAETQTSVESEVTQ